MDKNKLEAIAKKIIIQSPISEANYGSVILILMFVSIIITAVRVLQECNKNKIVSLNTEEKIRHYEKQIKEISIRRGWYTKMRLKKILRRELKPDDYRKHKNEIVTAILDVAENLKEDEVSTLMEAINA